ncbi:hypothetical protein SUDANB15_03448 [Streptomyces sp. enrichment culture]|uniref:phosphotransferase n=1 Tax=Streptomyces sp. enrichment culture TaxID=1795815 RepID=UPI003F5569C0
MSGDAGAVVGPLTGYHHETYVFPLPDATASGEQVRWKCREPRRDLLWFDRRCFVSEEQLLRALRGRVTGIPEVFRAGSADLQRFIEGATLGTLYEAGAAVPEPLADRVTELFHQMALIGTGDVRARRRCKPDDRPSDGDTWGFVERLVHFTEHRVYRQNSRRFESLFGSLGVDGVSFERLRGRLRHLTPRPFCLLHADLHRENFIVDPQGGLWVIDWELAMIGDPLYDLATHLHLMRYPERQETDVIERWRSAVGAARPGACDGWEADLPKLLDYKRAQSVFTDVIRECLSLETAPEDGDDTYDQAARRLHGVFAAAVEPLGLEGVPAVQDIFSALVRWHREHRGTAAPGHRARAVR